MQQMASGDKLGQTNCQTAYLPDNLMLSNVKTQKTVGCLMNR